MFMKKDDLKCLVIDGVEYVTTKQVCELTGYTYGSIYKKQKSGVLNPCKRPNGRVVYRLDEIQAAMTDGRLARNF